MTAYKLSEQRLTQPAANLTGAELIEVTQSGATKVASIDQIGNLMRGRREPVMWYDDTGNSINTQGYGFTGTIDITAPPFTVYEWYAPAVGQDILVSNWNGEDFGFWRITGIAGSLATVVRRYDSLIGSRIYLGDTVFCINTNQHYICNQVTNNDFDDTAQYMDVTGASTHSGYFVPSGDLAITSLEPKAIRVLDAYNAHNQLYIKPGFKLADCTFGNITLTLGDPTAAPQLKLPSGHDVSCEMVIRRKDTTSNVLTIDTVAGVKLNGVLSNSVVVPINKVVRFYSFNNEGWFSDL